MRVGRSPVVIVAPHGGTSERDLLEPPSRPVRSNDLHTADLALRIAERVDGSLLANDGVDRNEVDLNRIDEVVSRAPALFEHLADLVDRAIASHGRAEVAFIHGWHVVQPRCDVGVGARFARPAEAPADRLTVGPRYLASRVDAFRAACDRIGVEAAFGDRWPGAHPNNVLQVFRRSSERRFEGAAARLADAARAGLVEAVQLELGAALRWPGALREAFVEAFATTLGAAADRVDPDVARPAVASVEGSASDARATGAMPAGLRLYDPRAGQGGLGIVAGIGPMGGGRIGGRMLLFPGSQRLLLFTGEQREGVAGRVGALRLDPLDDGLQLRFLGHALSAPDGREHFRSERAQLAARVVEVSVDVRLRDEGRGFGIASGMVEIDGERRRVEARGFSGVAWGPAAGDPGQPEIRLAAAPGEGEGFVLRLRGGEASGLRHPAPGRPAEVVRGSARGPESWPGPVTLDLEGRTLHCEPRCHLTWLRSGADGRHAAVTVGVIGCGPDGAGVGGGVFEHVAPRSPGRPAREKTGLPPVSKIS